MLYLNFANFYMFKTIQLKSQESCLKSAKSTNRKYLLVISETATLETFFLWCARTENKTHLLTLEHRRRHRLVVLIGTASCAVWPSTTGMYF